MVELKLGYKASAEQFGPRELVELGVAAEQHGLDSATVSDHFQPWRHDGGHAPFSLAWLAVVASAGWALTTERVAKKPEGLDLTALLDLIEAQMKSAPDRLQWAMNHCLAQIGIDHPDYRSRALDIGERLQVLKDYPTPPGCTSPFAPLWITEIVRRQNA